MSPVSFAGGGPTAITLVSPDPLIPVELLDSTGAPVAGGRPTGEPGATDWLDLPVGFYRARLQTPGTQAEEGPFRLEAGQHLRFQLPAPEPLPGSQFRATVAEAAAAVRDKEQHRSRSTALGPGSRSSWPWNLPGTGRTRSRRS